MRHILRGGNPGLLLRVLISETLLNEFSVRELPQFVPMVCFWQRVMFKPERIHFFDASHLVDRQIVAVSNTHSPAEGVVLKMCNTRSVDECLQNWRFVIAQGRQKRASLNLDAVFVKAFGRAISRSRRHHLKLI